MTEPTRPADDEPTIDTHTHDPNAPEHAAPADLDLTWLEPAVPPEPQQ
jgi:hypothetical protein